MATRTLAIAFATALFAALPAALAQSAMPPMDGMQPISAPDQLPAPIHMTGIGNSHITIKATPDAQAWFDQGLTLYHDFWDYESAKAFEQAIRTDPNCAMCYWGLAQAEIFRGEEAKPYADQALAQADRLKRHASSTDRLYIDAALAELRAPGPRHQKGSGNAHAIAILRKLVAKQPHDPEARIFLANALGDGFDDNGEPKASTKEKIAILEAVLKDDPNDSAANHYWIHAMEPSNHPERAIPSAALLASLAPTSGHMVHMPGHIYYRTGDYASADRWFTASTQADERYMREQHVSVDDDWNYVHNLMYAIANQMEQGRLDDATALSDHLAGARGQLSATLYIWSARDQVARVSRRLPVALRTGDWTAVLALIDNANLQNNDKTTNLRFLRDQLRSFATGMQALDRGDLPAAREASAQMDAGLWRQSQDSRNKDSQTKETQNQDAQKQAAKCAPGSSPQSSAAPSKTAAAPPPPRLPLNPDGMSEPIISNLSIASMELRAGVLLLDGKSDIAKKLYTQAIAAEKKLGYHEPPFYIRPVAETEAEALLRAKDYTAAKSAYQAALLERPASGFELYGIAHADELAGNKDQAQSEYRAFLKAWPSADPKLPEILHARAALGDSTSVASR